MSHQKETISQYWCKEGAFVCLDFSVEYCFCFQEKERNETLFDRSFDFVRQLYQVR
jgi:hypothetical protein